jgi:hypothetical protein
LENFFLQQLEPQMKRAIQIEKKRFTWNYLSSALLQIGNLQ